MIKVLSDKANMFSGKPEIHSQEHAIAIDSIAEAIALKKPQTVALLNKYGIITTANPTNEELLNGLLLGFNHYADMQHEFAEMAMAGKKSRFSNVDGETSSMMSETWGSMYDPNYTGPNYGADYSGNSSSTAASSSGGSSWLSGISGVIGGIGGIMNMFNTPSTAEAMTQTNAQILALAAQKEAARKRNNIIAVVVTLLGSAIIIGVIYAIMHKKN